MDKTVSVANAREARKRDALLLAELIYDMFKEEEHRENDKMEDRQRDAEHTDVN